MTYFNTLPLFFGNLRGMEWIIIIAIGLLLFGGAASIRKVMRNAGKGVNAFKQGIEDAKAEMRKPLETDGEKGSATKSTAAAKDVDR